MAGCGCMSVTGWGCAAGSDGHARAGSGCCRSRRPPPPACVSWATAASVWGPAPPPPRPSDEASGTASFLRILVLPPHPAQLPLGAACEPFPRFLWSRIWGVGCGTKCVQGCARYAWRRYAWCVWRGSGMCVQGSQKYCVCARMCEVCVCRCMKCKCARCVCGGGRAGTAADPQAADRAGVLNLGARLTSGQDVVRPPGGSGSPRGGGRSLPGHSGRVVGVWHRPEVLPDSPGEGASWVGVGQQLSPAW